MKDMEVKRENVLQNYNVNVCVRENVYVREVVEQLEKSFAEVCRHINTNRVQANHFETNKNNTNVRVLQMDFTMTYECEYQNEIQSAF